MNRPQTQKNPAGRRGSSVDHLAGGSSTTVPTTADAWDEFAQHVDGAFVVVVRLTGGKYRRRCFLTVKAAENAARRAQDRGENAVVVLSELKPLYRVLGGEARD